MHNQIRHSFIAIILAGLAACGGGSAPPQSSPPGLNAAEGPEGGGAPPPPRSIIQGEFSITLLADSRIQQLVNVPVHVISADEDTAGRLASLKAADYWQSPNEGAVVIKRTFGQRGSSQHTVRVPSVPARDFVVLAADLAAPPGGRDDRIIRIPLKLDYTDPAKPVAGPIRVRLTPSGWQREN